MIPDQDGVLLWINGLKNKQTNKSLNMLILLNHQEKDKQVR